MYRQTAALDDSNESRRVWTMDYLFDFVTMTTISVAGSFLWQLATGKP
jgi:hypothetical protein